MPDYFKIDSRKITLREYWNIGRSWKALLAWGLARVGAPMQMGFGFSVPESVAEIEIPESNLSPRAREKMQPLIEQCFQRGFHSPRYYLHESIRRDVRTFFVSMLHRSGEFTLRLMHTETANGTLAAENLLAVLLSELNDGTFFFTSDQTEKFKPAPGVQNNRLIGGSPLQLIESHQQKLGQLRLRNPPKPMLSQEALDEAWNRYEKEATEFQIGRGLYVRMTPSEVESQQNLTQTAEAMKSSGVRHADVLVELNQLQNKKAGWGNAILIFVVSMLLFVGAGSRQWSWDYVVMLVPILFVHELGHYIAMRAFRYRNLRMFFIPFFGAAVSGQHFNVPGWKKVVVSMMGPVPGIILGVIIGGVGLVLHQPILIKVALVTLILNGINLLPVLPLDGGWVFHTLIFSRHHMLDAGFRVVAAIALMAGGMFSKDKILMYLGIPMLIGIPAAYRMARITRTLRDRGVSPLSTDDQTVPTDTALAIIDEVQRDLPKGHTNKMVAQQTLQVFENLNARPPGLLATGGLLLAYLASIGMAGIFAGVLLFAQRGDIGDLLLDSATQPKTELTCGGVVSWRGDESAGETVASTILVVARFAYDREAEATFNKMTNRLPASATTTLIADSVLLTLPSIDMSLRKQWFAELQSQTKTVFVEGTNSVTTFAFSCQMPSEERARKAAEELSEYLSASTEWSLIPPWLPDDERTPEQRAAHRLARKTFGKAQATQAGDGKDPQLRELQKKIIEARRQGDDAEVAALRRQSEKLSADLAGQRLENLKAGAGGEWDGVMLDLYRTWLSSVAATNREGDPKVMREMAQRMGQLPETSGAMNAGADRFSLRTGFTFHKDKTIQMNWLSFRSIADGAPALVDWLCAQGATDLKCDLPAGTTQSSDEE